MPWRVTGAPNAIQPRREAIRVTQRRAAPPGLFEARLNGVLGIGDPVADQSREPDEPPVVGRDKSGELPLQGDVVGRRRLSR